ncbi:MAG: histidinol-phosphate transaminase [Oscillospiraceae bacterium]|nr:histidinol-phosphate transaminase [Oscillospiraceae bacterium]
MSRYFSDKYKKLVPYVPGEQPKDRRYIKLNTNESPFPPSPLAQEMARRAADGLNLYSDPRCRDLVKAAAEHFGIDKDEILFTNGSDEILNFAFMAFCDADHPAVFPDITYGFYPVFADINSVPYETVPLNDDFTIDVEAFIGVDRTVFIANPNAPTGLALPLADIERIVASNPGNVVVIDEAYVDFGGESAVELIHKYDNLLVTQTFSKSRSMAGARLGFGIGCKELISDLNAVKYSINPYNVNSVTAAAGIGSFKDDEYFKSCCKAVSDTREWTADSLRALGFTVLDSKANFVFASSPEIGGKELYSRLRERGVLVRHFDAPRIREYNRITIGSPEQMRALIGTIKTILEDIR